MGNKSEKEIERKIFIQDIMEIAADGGINYWASHIRTNSRIPSLKFCEDEIFCSSTNTEDLQEFIVLAEDLEQAIQAIRDYKVRVSSPVRIAVLTADSANDSYPIDADSADCLIQIAAFGRLVYG